MKIIMNKKQLTDMIQKYQNEVMNFDGKVEIVAKEYKDMRDTFVRVTAVATGKLQLLGEAYDLTQEMNQTEVENIIKFYLEKEGYMAGDIRFISKKAYEEKYKQYDDYHGKLVLDNVEIEIKQKVKTKGEI